VRLSSFVGPEVSSTAPERSPLEPLSSFSRRSKKQRLDNARWEGQKRALRLLDRKQTEVPPPSTDPRLLP
jgi:hypothetical protein